MCIAPPKERADVAAPLAAPPTKMLWRLHGAEYDLEPFVRFHPGGELAIRLAQGIDDASDLFLSYHPQVGRGKAWETLQRFRVSANPPSASEPSPFRADIERMLVAHFKSEDVRAHSTATASHAWMVGACSVVLAFGWYAWFRGMYIGLLLVPLFHWLAGVNVSHDATHFALSRNARLNSFLSFISLPYFYGPMTWYSQHVVRHHTATNEVASDPDLQHFQPMKLHGADTRPHPETHTIFDYLKVFAVGIQLAVVVPLASAGAVTSSFAEWYRQQFDPAIYMPPGLQRSRAYRFLNVLSALSFFAALAYHPLCSAEMGVGKRWLFALLPPVCSSFIFALVTQVSHLQPDAQDLAVEAEPDFFKRQVRAQ
jgi:fatty acid desaturase